MRDVQEVSTTGDLEAILHGKLNPNHLRLLHCSRHLERQWLAIMGLSINDRLLWAIVANHFGISAFHVLLFFGTAYLTGGVVLERPSETDQGPGHMSYQDADPCQGFSVPASRHCANSRFRIMPRGSLCEIWELAQKSSNGCTTAIYIFPGLVGRKVHVVQFLASFEMLHVGKALSVGVACCILPATLVKLMVPCRARVGLQVKKIHSRPRMWKSHSLKAVWHLWSNCTLFLATTIYMLIPFH